MQDALPAAQLASIPETHPMSTQSSPQKEVCQCSALDLKYPPAASVLLAAVCGHDAVLCCMPWICTHIPSSVGLRCTSHALSMCRWGGMMGAEPHENECMRRCPSMTGTTARQARRVAASSAASAASVPEPAATPAPSAARMLSQWLPGGGTSHHNARLGQCLSRHLSRSEQQSACHIET